VPSRSLTIENAPGTAGVAQGAGTLRFLSSGGCQSMMMATVPG
jgi:hypothetical protein